MTDSTARGSRAFIAHFVRAQPRRTAVLTGLLVVSGAAEGLGFFSLLPLLEIVGTPEATESELSRFLAGVLGRVGIPMTLPTVLIVVVTAMIAKAGFLWLAMRQVGYAVAEVARDLRLRLIRALMNAAWSYYGAQPSGHFAAAISQEAQRASQAYRDACTLLAVSIRAAIYLGLAYILSWRTATVGIVAAAFVLVGLNRFVRMSRDAGRHQTVVMKSLVGRLAEALPGIKAVKAMAREQFFLPILERETEGLNDAQRRQVLAAESMRGFHEPLTVAVLALGAYVMVEFGSQPFESVLVLGLVFYRLLGTVNEMQKRYQAMATGESAFESIQGHIRSAEGHAEDIVGSEPAPGLAHHVSFESVDFSYGDGNVLNRVSFSVPAKRFSAFVGPSGGGKTTIIDLITTLLQPSAGEILVDGVPLSRVDARAWRNGVGYVPQDPLLFRGTILENVTLGDPSLNADAVTRALMDADAWGFVSGHPDGLARVLGEGGAGLSGGQRQRIAIARALVASPRLLVLDEATTALDPETEAGICETLVRLSRHTTVIAVSHQAAVREAAQHVFEVVDGRVVPQLAHADA